MENSVKDRPLSERCVKRTSRQQFDIVDITGGDGLWQRSIFIFVFFLQTIAAFHVFSMSFLAPNLDHWCARPPEAGNLSVEQWRNLTATPEDQHCSRYADVNFTHTNSNTANFSGNDTIPCESWEYDKTIYSSTVLSQFDLVCDRKWLVSLTKSVFMAGFLFSLLIFGHVSDWIGRKPVIMISGLITLCSGTISAFSTSFTMFLIVRFFIAVGVTVNVSTPYVYLMEIVSPKYRNIYGLAVCLGYSVGIVSLPLVAWLIRDSFWIQLAITAPCVILIIVCCMPESPRWLLNHGRAKEAVRVLSRAAKVNGVKLTVEDKTLLRGIIMERIKKKKSGGSKVNVCDLLKAPGLTIITLNIFFLWFVNAFVYYGLSINTNELAGNPFINFALSGLVEIPAVLLAICTIQSLGSRNLLAGSMVIGGMACIASYFLPTDPWWIAVAVSMSGKFFISISFGIVYIFSSELFPTVVRNIGMGSASVCGRFGTIIAPFMRELGDATHPIFPHIIFGVLSIFSGVLVFALPDTRKFSMPDTMEDAAQYFRRRRNKKTTPDSVNLVNYNYIQE